MKTIVKKTIKFETKRHDFDNDFAYIEHWQNTTLKDCYFAEKQYLFPDGSLKIGGTKYFYSPFSGEDIEKQIEPINFNKFKWFDRLFYINKEGEICPINQKCELENELSSTKNEDI